MFLLLIFTLFTTTLTAVEIPKAETWITQRVNADVFDTEQGNVANAVALRAQSAKEILDALGKTSGLNQASVLKPFISPSDTTEVIADALVSKHFYEIDVSQALAMLKIRQNSDGGFGHNVGYTSTVLDTALAIEALSKFTSTDSEIGKAIYFLKEHQQSDGSWSDIEGDKLYVSATVLRSLWLNRKSYDASTSMQGTVDYLATLKNADGSYGSEVYESALVLRSIAVFFL